MNITSDDKEVLREIKAIVEKIEKTGKLPGDLESITELYGVWNKAYKKNDRPNNCPTCRQSKFLQLKRTYDLFDLKNQFNPKPKKKPAPKKKKSK